MNCREVNQVLVSFLDHEIIPSESILIQAHLASCPACQQKLEDLSATRSRLIRSMKLKATRATPSPHVLSRLQMNLAEITRPSPSRLKRLALTTDHTYRHSHFQYTMKARYVTSILVILLIGVSVIACVPSARAKVVTIIASALPSQFGLQPGACHNVTGGAVGTGAFIWPTTSHKISGKDYSPELGHLAIDIAASEDSPIVAADTGVVVFAGWNTWGYGNMVLIDHRNGWHSLYAHLDVVKVACGESVGKSQLIGLAGQTGNSPAPHLHFELWKTSNGQVIKVNPHVYLPPP